MPLWPLFFICCLFTAKRNSDGFIDSRDSDNIGSDSDSRESDKTELTVTVVTIMIL